MLIPWRVSWVGSLGVGVEVGEMVLRVEKAVHLRKCLDVY